MLKVIYAVHLPPHRARRRSKRSLSRDTLNLTHSFPPRAQSPLLPHQRLRSSSFYDDDPTVPQSLKIQSLTTSVLPGALGTYVLSEVPFAIKSSAPNEDAASSATNVNTYLEGKTPSTDFDAELVKSSVVLESSGAVSSTFDYIPSKNIMIGSSANLAGELSKFAFPSDGIVVEEDTFQYPAVDIVTSLSYTDFVEAFIERSDRKLVLIKSEADKRSMMSTISIDGSGDEEREQILVYTSKVKNAIESECAFTYLRMLILSPTLGESILSSMLPSPDSNDLRGCLVPCGKSAMDYLKVKYFPFPQKGYEYGSGDAKVRPIGRRVPTCDVVSLPTFSLTSLNHLNIHRTLRCSRCLPRSISTFSLPSRQTKSAI